MRIPNELSSNFSDINVRRKLIKDYGDHPLPFSGTNEKSESVLVSIHKERGIVVYTEQKNGRVRVNSYNKHGQHESEGYDGRWK